MTLAPRRFCLALAVLVVAGAPLPAQPSPGQPDPMTLVREGRKLNNEGKQDSAIVLFMQALKASPDLVEAHSGLGAALDLQGKYDEARHHLTRAIELASPTAKSGALRSMAVSYAFERKAAEAEKYERQAFDALVAANDFNTAAGAANEMGRIALESDDISRAVAWYRSGNETARKIPNMPDSVKNLWDFRWEHAQARVAARQGKRDDAQKHVAAAKAALDKVGNAGQAGFYPYLTGYVAFYAGDYKTAIADLLKADQEDPFIQSLTAQAYEKSGDKAKAMELYRMVLTSNAHNPTNAFARPLAKKKVA